MQATCRVPIDHDHPNINLKALFKENYKLLWSLTNKNHGALNHAMNHTISLHSEAWCAFRAFQKWKRIWLSNHISWEMLRCGSGVSQCVISTYVVWTSYLSCVWSELTKLFINVTKLEEKAVLTQGEDLRYYHNGFILCKRCDSLCKAIRKLENTAGCYFFLKISNQSGFAIKEVGKI